MFKIVSKIGTLISCRKHILRDKPGKVVSPSEITKNWSENITKPEFETVKLLYVGRMNIEKGIFSLLKILNNIDESINLTIIGESRQKKSKVNGKNINISPIETKEEKLIKLYDKTLSEKDLDQISKKIIEVVKETTGATIRS